MKKKFALLSALFFIFTAGCSRKPSITIKDNQATNIDTINDRTDNNEQTDNQGPIEKKNFGKLFFRTEDYMGGSSEERIIYFFENYFLHQSFDVNGEREEIFRRSFTDEDKIAFTDAVYEAGLLNIAKEYRNDNVSDGGGWELYISFEDGTEFHSFGENAGPYDVFKACAIPFYELCGEEVFSLPEYYLEPPMVDITFDCEIYSTNYFNNVLFNVEKGNYSWNNSSLTNVDYYLLNLNNYDKNRATEIAEYGVEFGTQNYRYSKRFANFKLTEYNFDSNLTYARVLYDAGFFVSINFSLEMDKIYVFKMTYDDGNFVEYTFCTKIN